MNLNKKVLCDICFKEIKEKYYLIEEKDICKECFSKYFANNF